MKLIQQAKFAAGAIRYYSDTEESGLSPNRTGSVIQPAIIEIDGLRFSSDTPKTAAEAFKINERVNQWTAAIHA